MTAAPLIMAIDDEKAVTLVLTRTLQEAGYRVSAFNSSVAAMNELESVKPDLILLDVRMPEMDGYQTLARIKETNEEIPVLMLTAVPDAESVDKSINLGADDYIRKPFRSAELLARIKVKLRRAGKLE